MPPRRPQQDQEQPTQKMQSEGGQSDDRETKTRSSGDEEVHPSVERNTEENEQRHENAPGEAPGGFHPDDARASVAEGREIKGSVGDPLSGLSRNELVRLRTAVDATLDGWGGDPEDSPAGRGPSIRETASSLPSNPAAAKDMDRSSVAGKLGDDVEEDQVLAYGVRQEGAGSDPEKNTGHGPAYLTAVLKSGEKKVVKL